MLQSALLRFEVTIEQNYEISILYQVNIRTSYIKPCFPNAVLPTMNEAIDHRLVMGESFY